MMRYDGSGVVRALTAIEQRHLFGIQAYGNAVGTKLVKYAKTNRPWTDRTYTAKNRIETSTAPSTKGVRVNLHGRVYYHVYLEFVDFKHKGRLSIFWPTIEKVQPEALQGWAKVVKT